MGARTRTGGRVLAALVLALALAGGAAAQDEAPRRAKEPAPRAKGRVAPHAHGSVRASSARPANAHPARPAASAAPVSAPAPEVVLGALPPVDLNALLEPESNGTVFHKDGVDDRVSQALRLQPRIDAWVEGSVISLENGQLQIYGRRLPYATLYARMMRDVVRRSAGLTGKALADAVHDVQHEWQKKNLPVRDLETPDTDVEMKFVLARGGQVALLDESAEVAAKLTGPLRLPASSTVVTGAPVDGSAKKSEDSDEPPNDSAFSRQAKDAAEILSAAGGEDDQVLHLGDKIRVGYDSTRTPEMAFVAFRVAKPSSVIAVDP